MHIELIESACVLDCEEARLLEEKYITTIKTTPPEFVKALSPVQELQPGQTARYEYFVGLPLSISPVLSVWEARV